MGFLDPLKAPREKRFFKPISNAIKLLSTYNDGVVTDEKETKILAKEEGLQNLEPHIKNLAIIAQSLDQLPEVSNKVKSHYQKVVENFYKNPLAEGVGEELSEAASVIEEELHNVLDARGQMSEVLEYLETEPINPLYKEYAKKLNELLQQKPYNKEHRENAALLVDFVNDHAQGNETEPFTRALLDGEVEKMTGKNPNPAPQIDNPQFQEELAKVTQMFNNAAIASKTPSPKRTTLLARDNTPRRNQ